MTAPVNLAFTIKERDRRWALTRKFMDEHQVEALVIYGESEVTGPGAYTPDNWVTNQRPGSTVLFPRHGNPLWLTGMAKGIISHWHSEQASESPWISAAEIRIGRDSSTLINTIHELKLATSAIGVCGLEPFIPVYPGGIIPYTFWSKVVAEFPQATFKDIGQAFSTAIMPLSDEQISVLRHASSIGDDMARAMVKASAPGVPENEVYSAGMNAAYLRGANAPLIHMFTGPQAINWGPPRWTYSSQSPPRVLEDGDIVTGELFCDFGKLQIQVQITIAVGKAHEDLLRADTIVRECYDAGLKALKVGSTFGEVAKAMRFPLEKHGAWSKGPQIHSLNPLIPVCEVKVDLADVGVPNVYPQKWTMNTIAPDVVLKAAMSFAMEPTCAIGPYAVTIGGTVVVADGEPIELSTYTTRLLRAP
ncbi:hypothetical protein G7046_g9046 [Stylonectria norvegica]|nr:hypothetical protein G7046_g9046 [Stylonectria norvegica]